MASKQLSISHGPSYSTIILTGSTGNLGCYILDCLLQIPAVSRIICLNRTKDARKRQLALHAERGLSTYFDGRVYFHVADFSLANLGLSSRNYHDLAAAVDMVIHNAWPVNFNHNFKSFQSSIEGVDGLVRFCLADATRPTKFVFISSFAAVQNFAAAAPSAVLKVPEAEIRDWKVARTGYGQSKLISERLIAHAARENGLLATVVRVGQLGGPVEHRLRGKWNEKEWLPSIIRSSAYLGVLPGDLGPSEMTDWVPVDTAAGILMNICFHQENLNMSTDSARFYHLVNPQITKWSELTSVVLQYFHYQIQVVNFVEWVEALKESARTHGDEESNPAIRLSDFFDRLRDRAIRFPKTKAARLDTKETCKISDILVDLPAVNTKWMELWLQQWNWSLDHDPGRERDTANH